MILELQGKLRSMHTHSWHIIHESGVGVKYNFVAFE